MLHLNTPNPKSPPWQTRQLPYVPTRYFRSRGTQGDQLTAHQTRSDQQGHPLHRASRITARQQPAKACVHHTFRIEEDLHYEGPRSEKVGLPNADIFGCLHPASATRSERSVK
ncbi:hypothetical protein K458DRAFT_27538 [Lentithecium fluviatile CBS 122367]|uniref:Uncharacterized protein n=1 Tax=Lentithecium fluviatile CBS 122367 TaxID=1168545 RepID=A0A6G1J3Q4_9PLEO|nr:hypothetical protein K458DRAFT_27538 [Lentithecium fluviatile CBS 122367]